MSERIVLDPSQAIASRTELDITEFIDQDGIDWGEASIEPVLADRDRGSVPVDFRVPNREITVPLLLVTRGTVTAIQARAKIQAKAALFQKEGGWIKRVTNSGGTVFADVVDAGFTATSVSGLESAKDIDLDAQLTLTCLPDFYEVERTLSDHTETTNPELIFTETGIDGDYPARVRIVVDDDQGQDQRGLIWAFRSRHHSSASTAALTYKAKDLTPLDTAFLPTLTGSAGGEVVKHGTLSTNWTPVLGTNIGGSVFFTHTGTYHLWGRVYSTSGTTVQARAVYDVGDLVNPAENDQWRLPGASNFYVHDFGEIRLDPPAVGTHRWQGQIQAKGDVGGENISVDKIWLEPVDEGSGVLTAPINLTQGLSTYSARSEFNTESGAITGDALAVGGNWTVVTNSDPDDFSQSASTAIRTAVSDAGTGNGVLVGRGVTAGTTNYTNIVAQIDFKWSTWNASGALFSGLLLRVTDSANYLYAALHQSPAASLGQLEITKVVAGASTVLKAPLLSGSPTQFNTIQFMVLANGTWACSVASQGAVPFATASGMDSALATGGTLATGKVGFFDYTTMATPGTRTYDNFAAWVPTPDAVTFASRSTQLTTDGHYRLDSGGTAHGPVSIPSGDLPRLPVAGLEGRTTEVFLKPSRGDFDQLPDSGIDDISARIYYSPSWLTVPDT